MAEPPVPPAAPPVDPWEPARRFTPARIRLPRAGAALATAPLLDFRLAHARARDAVRTELDAPDLCAALDAIGWDGPVRIVDSAAGDRRTYLMRPDLGRRLSASSSVELRGDSCDLAVVVADGLSARAVQTHAPELLAALASSLRNAGWRIAPPVVVRQGRVAVGDAIALRLRAKGVLVLIGERPGLSAPDSMGAYLTWKPAEGTTDAERNCVSNIRPEGIPYPEAATTIAALLGRMRQLGQSGVVLKDESAVIAARGIAGTDEK